MEIISAIALGLNGLDTSFSSFSLVFNKKRNIFETLGTS